MKNHLHRLLLVFVAVLLMALLTFGAAADSTVAEGTCGANLTWKLDSNGVLTISGTGDMSDSPWYYKYRDSITTVVIDNGVSSVGGGYAFKDCVNLSSVTIPDSITGIGSYAFSGCSSLAKVTIPNSVKRIGDYAFNECVSLKTILIPESTTTIGRGVFSGCTSLMNIEVAPDNPQFYSDDGVLFGRVYSYSYIQMFPGGRSGDYVIPNGVKQVRSGAFSGCTHLNSVTIPDSITYIEWYTFDGCTSLKTVEIPDSVHAIGQYAFRNCSSLTSVKIPDRQTSIDDSTFEGCSSLTSVKIPDGVTRIQYKAFYGCSGLTSIELPDSVTQIDTDAFAGCSRAASLKLSNNVTIIGGEAFYGCSSLTSIKVPDSVTRIGGSAFSGCSNLISVNIPDGVPSIESGTFKGCSNLPAIDIPNSVTKIEMYAFTGCSSLKTVDIPDSVTTIAGYAFSDCPGLTAVTGGNSVTSIGENAFQNCVSLMTMNIPSSVSSIGGYAFLNCSGLKTVTISEGVTSIEKYAFQNCTNLETLFIPKSVKSIGIYAFQNCSGLTTAVISEGVTSIGRYAFQDCTSLVHVNIPEGIAKIETRLFDNCTSLSSVSMPSSLTTIDSYAFSGCTALKAVDIADIASWCQVSFSNEYSNPLYYSSGLLLNGVQTTHLTIPDRVTSISKYAFYHCNAITSLTIPNYVTVDQRYAFNSCSNLAELELPAELLRSNVQSNPFSGCTSLSHILVTGEGEIPDYSSVVWTKPWGGVSGSVSVEFSEGITSIGSNCFYNIQKLISVTIPASVTEIKNNAFYGCTGLQSVNIADSGAWCRITFGNQYSNPILYTHSLLLDQNRVTQVTIPDDVRNISAFALSGLTDLTSVTIPESVIKIGASAFQNCSSLTELTVPDSVTSIGSYAFEGCTGLTTICIPAHGAMAFNGCSAVTSVTLTGPGAIPDMTEYSKERTAWYCSSAAGNQITLKIMNGVTGIGDYAFDGCEGLIGKISFPDSLQRIGKYAFNKCKGLTGDLYLPDSVMEIGEYAFYKCSGLNGTLSISAAIEELPEYVFADTDFNQHDNIKFTLYLPESVKTVAPNAFSQYSVTSDGKSFYKPPTATAIYYGGTENQFKELFQDVSYYVEYYVDGSMGIKHVIQLTKAHIFPVFCNNITYNYGSLPGSISITTTRTLLQASTTTQFTAKVYPSDARNKVIKWASSDESVATVSASGLVTAVGPGVATITAASVNGKTDQRTITVRDDLCVIYVYGQQTPENNITLSDLITHGDAIPLQDAEVNLAGVKHTTDAEGCAIFHKYEFEEPEKAFNGELKVSAGTQYFAETAQVTDGVAHSARAVNTVTGSNTFYLRNKGDDIYILSASVVSDGTTYDLLNGRKSALIEVLNDDGSENKTSYNFYVETDWNRYQKGTIKLVGTESKRSVSLREGNNYLRLATMFDPMESIELQIETKNEQGEVVSETAPLKLKLSSTPDLTLPETDTVQIGGDTESGGIYFLDKLTSTIKLGDLAKVASEISYKDGVLTLKFTGKDGDDSISTKLFGNALEMETKKLEVKVIGEIKIPVKDAFKSDSDWSGQLGFAIGASTSSKGAQNFEKNISKLPTETIDDMVKTVTVLDHEYHFFPPWSPVPLYMDIELNVGLSGNLGVHGPYNKVYFKGDVTFKGGGSVAGGIGGEFTDDLELKLGLKGALDVKIPLEFDTQNMQDPVTFDPSISGTLSGEAKIKTWFHDLKATIELGKITWSASKGVEWSSDLMNLTQDDGEDWHPIGRGYRANGGGFTGSGLSLMEDSQERTPQMLYNNIVSCADAVPTRLADGTLCLIMAMDDTTRDQYNMLRLAYSLYDPAANSWSEPVWVDDDPTMDTTPYANGAYVIWEDTDRVLTSEDALADVLRETGISAGVWNGSGYTVTRLTAADGVYDFCGKIAADGERAFAAWLSNSEGDYSSRTGITDIHYATYENGVWSESAVLAENIGTVTNLNVSYSNGVGTVYYKVGTELNTLTTTGEQSSRADLGRYAVNGSIVAWFTDQTLHIMENGVETVVLESNFSGKENPVVVSDGENAAVFWLESDGIYYTNKDRLYGWSGRLCLQSDESHAISELHAAPNGDGYFVSYLSMDEVKTDLYTLITSPGVDLAVLDVSYDDAFYYETGLISYQADLYNNSESITSGVLEVTNSEGTVVHSRQFSLLPGDGTAAAGQFVAVGDGNYTFTVIADSDYHSGNNSAVLSVGGKADAEIQSAWFQANSLFVRAANAGSVPVEHAKLTIRTGSETGPIAAELPLETLERGESRLVELDLKQDRNEIYYISLDFSADEYPANNLYLISYEDFTPTFRTGSLPLEASVSGKKVTVAINPGKVDLSDGARMIAAAYSANGQLMQTLTTDIAPDKKGELLTIEKSFDQMPAGGYVQVFLVRQGSFSPLVSAVTAS